MNCKHTDTKYEDWPDGGVVEVCQNCGMSRYHWEWGETQWIIIDVKESKKEVRESLESLQSLEKKE